MLPYWCSLLTAVSPAAEEEVKARSTRVVWCAVGPEEQRKCQQWSQQSDQRVTCATASTTDDCIALVLVGGLPPACERCGWGAQATASAWRGAGSQRCFGPQGARVCLCLRRVGTDAAFCPPECLLWTSHSSDLKNNSQ